MSEKFSLNGPSPSHCQTANARENQTNLLSLTDSANNKICHKMIVGVLPAEFGSCLLHSNRYLEYYGG